MKVWKLSTDGYELEIWNVDDETGELGGAPALRIEMTEPMTSDEARLWMQNHYPTAQPSTEFPK